MNLFLPAVERLSRVPGKALVLASATGNALLLFFGFLAGQRLDTTAGWMPFAAGVVFTAILVFFAVRRDRLEKRLDTYIETECRHADHLSQLDNAALSGANADEIVIDEDGRIISDPEMWALKEENRLQAQQRRADAEREAAIVKTTFLPNLEAAQRAAIAAAGGVENVPHLQDDLRWTIASAFTTLVSLPVIGFLIVLAIIFWL